MKKSSFLISLPVIALCFITSCSGGKKSSPASQFVGTWYAIKGDVEALDLYSDSTGNNYTGTIEDRPMTQGSWKLENGKFCITPVYDKESSAMIAYDYEIRADTLYLNKGEQIFTINVPPEIRHREIAILKNLRSNLGPGFSEPKESEVNWLGRELKGYSITIDSKTGSGVEGKIISYLTENGFIRDTLYVTEICSGFTYEKLWGVNVVTVCSSMDPENENGTVSCIVSSATKK